MPRDKKRVASDSDSDSGPEDRGPAKKVKSIWNLRLSQDQVCKYKI